MFAKSLHERGESLSQNASRSDRGEVPVSEDLSSASFATKNKNGVTREIDVLRFEPSNAFAERLLESAGRLVARRSFDSAIKMYLQLLELNPDEALARGGIREALSRKFQNRNSSKLVVYLVGALPLTAAAFCKVFKNHRQAARAYEGYLRHDPFHEGINGALAHALEQSGALKSALMVYRFITKINPENAEALSRAGTILAHFGANEEALTVFEQASKIAPRDPEIQKARKNLAAALALDSTRLRNARSYRDLIKETEEAQRAEREKRISRTTEEISVELGQLEELLFTAAGDRELLLRKADLLRRLGRKEEALAVYGEVITEGTGAEVLACRGELILEIKADALEGANRIGDIDGARKFEREFREAQVEEYERRIEASPTDKVSRLKLGKALVSLGRVGEAIAEFQKCKDDPRLRSESRMLLGEAFFREGHVEIARRQLEGALEGVSEESDRGKEILFLLGEVAEREGKSGEAMAFYCRIYERDIGYRDVAARVERIQLKRDSLK